jgi:hypothetical protein
MQQIGRECMNLRQSSLSKNTGSNEKKEFDRPKVPVIYDNMIEAYGYRSTLDKHKNYLLNIPNKIEAYSKNLMEGQLSSIQIGMALAYIKEQMDKSKELLEYMKVNQEKNAKKMQEAEDDKSYKEQSDKALAILEEIKNEQIRSMQEMVGKTTQNADDLSYIKGQSKKALGAIEEIKIEQTKNIQETLQSIVNLTNNREQNIKTLGLLTEIKAQQEKKEDIVLRTSTDLEYIKDMSVKTIELLSIIKSDQEKKAQEQLENLITSIIETNFKLDEMDKGIVNRVSEISTEVQRLIVYQNKQIKSQREDNIDRLTGDVRKNSNLIWFVIGFQILGLSALAAIILYVLEIIPF